MALREGRCLFDRRIADRGNDRSMFGSRAHGRDRFSTSRTADRGSGGIDPDPRDLKIKRLRKRVWNLEIQQEITRLRQRIRDLELKGEMRKTETESSTIVGDECDDGEEHPFYHHPPWFFEPICPESVLEENLVFDGEGTDYSKDECLFVNHSNGEFSYDSPPRFDKYGDEEEYTVVDGSVAMATGGDVVTTGGDKMIVGVDLFLEAAIVLPKFMEPTIGNGNYGLNFEIPISNYGINLEIPLTSFTILGDLIVTKAMDEKESNNLKS